MARQKKNGGKGETLDVNNWSCPILLWACFNGSTERLMKSINITNFAPLRNECAVAEMKCRVNQIKIQKQGSSSNLTNAFC